METSGASKGSREESPCDQVGNLWGQLDAVRPNICLLVLIKALDETPKAITGFGCASPRGAPCHLLRDGSKSDQRHAWNMELTAMVLDVRSDAPRLRSSCNRGSYAILSISSTFF